MKKAPTPRRIAVLTSIVIALTGFLFFISIDFIFNLSVPIIYIVIYPLIAFLTSFLFYSYTLEKFIHNKIKIIYKTIGQPKKFFRELKDHKNQIISSVEHDVAEWAINKNKQIRELRKLETYRREFVGNVSHELKTPIFNAQGYLQTLLEEGIDKDPKMSTKYLERAAANVDRLETIVKDLEEISKYESGALKLNYSSFDIHALTKEVTNELKFQAKEQSISFRFTKIPSPPLIAYADKNRVYQVLSNLISNSIKYGKVDGFTTINYYDLDEQIMVEVADNGPGIEEKNIPRLFERFFRADKSRARKIGGTGLGLAIVKNIIESHNQTINVHSVVGEGTTFNFTLQKYLPK